MFFKHWRLIHNFVKLISDDFFLCKDEFLPGKTVQETVSDFSWDIWTTPRPPVLDDHGAPPRGRKPVFTKVPPMQVNVMEGDPLTLRCSVDGDPKPLGNNLTINRTCEMNETVFCTICYMFHLRLRTWRIAGCVLSRRISSTADK